MVVEGVALLNTDARSGQIKKLSGIFSGMG